MKLTTLGTIALVISGFMLGGCGGGGDDSPPPSTQATAKMYLFGTMSSASAGRSAGVVDSVKTTILSVPAGLFVNYTSQAVPGDPANSYRLRGGVVVPSGPALIPAANITALFNTVTRDVTLSLMNSGGGVNLIADTVSNAGKGVEVATINFSLAAGETPAVSATGTATSVQQFRTIGGPDIRELNGCAVNFETTYQ